LLDSLLQERMAKFISRLRLVGSSKWHHLEHNGNFFKGHTLFTTGAVVPKKHERVDTRGVRSVTADTIYRFCHQLASPKSTKQEEQIYNGILSTQIKLVKIFSLSTSLIGMACQPVLYTYSSQANLGVAIASGAFLSFFTFVTPLLIHSISKKYVTKLYYNQVEDKYTAHVYNLFVRSKRIEFRISDVKVPDIPGMFTTFTARNVPLFVDMDQFQDPKHYGKIMGYDKQLDFKWDEQLDETKTEAIGKENPSKEK